MKQIKSRLRTELGRQPLREEIAKRMGLETNDIEDLEALSEKKISLSDKFFNEDTEVGDRIKDELSPSVEIQIVKNSVQHQIRDLLKDLSEKEATVLKLRFGFFDDQVFELLSRDKHAAHLKKIFKANKVDISEEDFQNKDELKKAIQQSLPLTLQSVGAIMGLTRERIRQIEKKTLRKLSRSHKLRQLRGYLN
jgi:RNA polymerase primary sigma factor